MSDPINRTADLPGAAERALQGGAPKYHEKNARAGKLFVRDRLRLLLDDAEGFVEDGLCLLYTSPSPRDRQKSRMPSSA